MHFAIDKANNRATMRAKNLNDCSSPITSTSVSYLFEVVEHEFGAVHEAVGLLRMMSRNNVEQVCEFALL